VRIKAADVGSKRPMFWVKAADLKRPMLYQSGRCFGLKRPMVKAADGQSGRC